MLLKNIDNILKYPSLYFLIFLVQLSLPYAQRSYSQIENTLSFTTHTGWVEEIRTNKYNFKKDKIFYLTYANTFYLNTNLPNTENLGGNYFAKGYGSLSQFNVVYHSKLISLSFSPSILINKSFNISTPEKINQFSVLNDNQRNYSSRTFRNSGFQLHYNHLSMGFGNWNHWWGPGIHNSLVLSNNAEGFYHYYLGTRKFIEIFEDMSISARYVISNSMINNNNSEFYFSALFINLKFKNVDFGYARNILSGGYPDRIWSLYDASTVIFSKKSLRYWDTIDDFYIFKKFPRSNLELFVEIAIPNRAFNENGFFVDHAIGSNIGFRKKNIFNNSNLFIGTEYTRLIQSSYYNILPSPNWYDNNKYNYSSYKNRRWAAHAGSDSDDLLLFFGYMDKNKRILYGINYERHGVTFSFPPEVKFESRLSISYNHNNLTTAIYYENEYFEHYGFVDKNVNVWNETFEPGSIQRTKSILLSIEYNIF
tara:strand:+ start:21600 stop:23039 length:1440 start_codon:yes stop_codon:yes gene_type:complete